MLRSMFGRKPTAVPDDAQSGKPRFDAEGIHYQSPGGSTSAWLAAPFASGSAADADLGARLGQMCTEGIGQAREREYLLFWDEVYALLRDPELSAYRDALLIPPLTDARPGLASKSALLDSDFTLLVDGWFDAQGFPLDPAPDLMGCVLRMGSATAMISEPVHRLLAELMRFHSTPTTERSTAFKVGAFGRIRQLAMASGCLLSDYVKRTVVITPERLRLGIERRRVDQDGLIEVIPSFEEVPARWLEHFDRLPLQDSYSVPDGASLVRVVISPDVRSVLAEIKRMPGRRVTGARAQAFVRNPFAAIGESARQVIDPDRFEHDVRSAGIVFYRFTPCVEHGPAGEVFRVGLMIEPISDASSPVTTSWFGNVAHLAQFTEKLERALDDGSQCLTWEGRELEILGDTRTQGDQLGAWLRAWRGSALWTASEVFDLRNYSARVEGIGIEKAFAIPFIARNDKGNGWFPDNVTMGIRIDMGDDLPPLIAPIEQALIPSLEHALTAAEQRGQTEVCLPGIENPIPIGQAREAVEALVRARAQVQSGDFVPSDALKLPPAKQRLLIKRNLEEIDYNEERADSLAFSEDGETSMPRRLKADTELKPYQRVGVAWLQHLWRASPKRCRGTVLADDMGLGKTLQLLAFISSCFDDDPSLPPALVVAPVALLENWRNEVDRFFEPDALPILMLYGDALRSLRVGRHEVDDDLRLQGVTRLLKKNWVGNARLVLTTYETMRDLEFAMASQCWSVMVCDEAQKIKNPAALVTRAAKKQKVRFRIACTGTPVENTLADLWCLFDFVQPGMLGALNHFSRTYRQPIEAKTADQIARVDELRRMIEPQILHRKKTDVARELPRPQEDQVCKRLPMSPFQLRLYEGALNVLREQRATNPASQLQALMAIRKICSDPHGFSLPESRSVPIDRLIAESPKMGWLVKRLKILISDPAGEHKVIVFCEFRELQIQLQRVIAAVFGIAPSIVNGDTSADPQAHENRQKLIDRFQQKAGFNVIVLSPLAVGFGVNIQSANHVVHFTRTWNPAKEDQATARAYRIGQRRVVQVYCPGVVSESFPSFDVRIDELLSAKRALASDILNGCSDIKVGDFAEFV